MNRSCWFSGFVAVAAVSLLVLGCSEQKPTGTESLNGDPVMNGCNEDPAVQTELEDNDTCVVLNSHEKCRKNHRHHKKHKKPHPKDGDTSVTPVPEPVPEPTPAPEPTPEPEPVSLSGCWSVNQNNGHIGILQLTQTGISIEGLSGWTTHSNGPIAGTVSGNALSFTISYPEGVTGYYNATVSQDGNTLTNGTTRSSTGDYALWEAARTDCPVQEPISVPEPEPTPAPQPCGMGCFSTDANTIVHWTFDAIENGLVPDQSINGFNATPFGGPTLATATCGSAISLSGSGQYLDAYNWNRLIGYSKVTYDVLFKINSMRDDGTAAGDMLSELVNDSHWYPIGGAVVRVRNGVCQFAIASTSGWQHLTDVVPVSFGEWHHVSASFDQTTSTMTLQLDCNAPVSMTYGGTFVPSHVSYIRIGSCVVDPPSRFVNGAIDAIIIKGWK